VVNIQMFAHRPVVLSEVFVVFLRPFKHITACGGGMCPQVVLFLMHAFIFSYFAVSCSYKGGLNGVT
jgi:hypothetical protein